MRRTVGLALDVAGMCAAARLLSAALAWLYVRGWRAGFARGVNIGAAAREDAFWRRVYARSLSR